MIEFSARGAPAEDTDCFRAGSGPGFEVDCFAGHWLVQTRGNRFPEFHQDQLQKARSLWWKRLDQNARESPRWMAGEKLDEAFIGTEHGVRYLLDFTTGYSQGLFVDQRLNRAGVRLRCASDSRLLNLFAYTCGFSVCGALGGAITTNVDLSRGYLEWGKRNFELNGLDPSEHFFTRGDCFDWLGRWRKSGIRFDGIVLDPPTFSRNGKMVFRVEKDYGRLVELAMGVMNEGGWMLCCTNYRGMEQENFERIVRQAVGFSRALKMAGMPPEFGAEAYLKSVWVE